MSSSATLLPRLTFCCGLLFICNLGVTSAFNWPSSRSLHGTKNVVKRDDSKVFEIPFNFTDYYGDLYGFNCSVGSPPQNITLGIFIAYADSHLGNSLFNPPWTDYYELNRSDTAKINIQETTFDNSSEYLGSKNFYNVTGATANYSSDVFRVEGAGGQTATFDDFAFLSTSNRTFSDSGSSSQVDLYTFQWIGLGLSTGQAAVITGFEYEPGKPYPSFTERFVSKGLIASNTYSIWLDDIKSRTGHLLLGGLNSKRYKGTLVNLPTSLTNAMDMFGWSTQQQLTVGIKSLTIGSSNPIDIPNPPSDIALAHEYVSFFPPECARAIWDAVGANYPPDLDENDPQTVYIRPTVPCSFLTNSTTINIVFSGAEDLTLEVPMSYITRRNGTGPTLREGPYGAACVLLIVGSPPGVSSVLSSGMLRNLYTVFDLENNIVSVALIEPEHNNTNNLISIPTEGVAAISRDAFGPDESAGDDSPETGLNRAKTTAIGLGVGMPVAALLAALVGLALWWRKRKQRNYASVKPDGESGNSMPELKQNLKPGELNGADDVQHRRSELLGVPVNERKVELQSNSDGISSMGSSPTTTHADLRADQRHELSG